MKEHAWHGDWIERVYQRVQVRGFPSLSAFADARPSATLMQLAAELGEDVAAIQLEGLLHAEAEKSGTLGRFARDLLARCIRDQLPMGWNAGEQFALQRAGVFASWSAGVRGFMDKPARKMIWETIKHADIEAGWLPAGPDDPIIERAFAGVRFDAPSRQVRTDSP